MTGTDAVGRELADLRAKLVVAVEALDIQSRWVRSSLDCPAFPWDCDQRYVAELQYKEARAALAQIRGDE